MIDPDKRNAIYQLHLAGRPLREISRQLQVSRNAVRAVIRQQGARPKTVRKDKIQIDPDLLRRLYQECEGWLQRMHEKLVEEHKIQVSYPTLTRLVRALGLSQPRRQRCLQLPICRASMPGPFRKLQIAPPRLASPAAAARVDRACPENE